MRDGEALLGLLDDWDRRPGPIGLDDLVGALGSLAIGRADLGGAVIFDDDRYHRTSIRRRPHYEALVIGWRCGQRSPIHDHAGSACAVLVVSGRATETRFEPTPCGLLAPTGSTGLPAGTVIGCEGGSIHQLANLGPPGSELVTLHVYSPPPGSWRCYPVGATTLAGLEIVPDAAPAPPVPLAAAGGGVAW